MVEQLVGQVVGKQDVELDLADKVVEGLTEPRAESLASWLRVEGWSEDDPVEAATLASRTAAGVAASLRPAGR